MGKHGGIMDIVMWVFLGSILVLIVKFSKGFSTAVGTVVQPVEYESTLIATGGWAGAVPIGVKGYPS